eukprot:360618-Chlamydomonas_euryale.AAC.3
MESANRQPTKGGYHEGKYVPRALQQLQDCCRVRVGVRVAGSEPNWGLLVSCPFYDRNAARIDASAVTSGWSAPGNAGSDPSHKILR